MKGSVRAARQRALTYPAPEVKEEVSLPQAWPEIKLDKEKSIPEEKATDAEILQP